MLISLAPMQIRHKKLRPRPPDGEKGVLVLGNPHRYCNRKHLHVVVTPNGRPVFQHAQVWTVQTGLAKGLHEIGKTSSQWHATVQRGLSEREAVRSIVDAKLFPYYERQSSQRRLGHA